MMKGKVNSIEFEERNSKQTMKKLGRANLTSKQMLLLRFPYRMIFSNLLSFIAKADVVEMDWIR